MSIRDRVGTDDNSLDGSFHCRDWCPGKGYHFQPNAESDSFCFLENTPESYLDDCRHVNV